MVRLTRIYTRTGDDGTTALGDGTRLPKTAPRIEAYGTVDELNAIVGQCAEHCADAALLERLRRIQHDLFDLGADLCMPFGPSGARALRIGARRATRLETWIDEANAPLAPLKSFVLPGGGPLAAALHVARTVARRAERRVLALAAVEDVNHECVVYLNRLSDLFFVLARVASGAREVLWTPTHDEPGNAGPAA